ncbi:hypothetical protein [Paraburkholderia fungorum]|uniref:hypothetical protein n=1 Tax=Paraburkholderia fungorum TaxID=134537 RepID=UPI0011C49A35|nr:hypothetical protein [Paraburkholderia fungorum]
MKSANRIICSPIFFLLPGVCLADTGSPGGIPKPLLYLAAFIALWLLITGVFFWRLRRLPSRKRAGLTVLFFLAPVLCFFVLGGGQAILGKAGRTFTVVAEHPVVIAGVTFPAGSKVSYEQLGGGYWHKRPIFVQSDKPVMAGAVEITELMYSRQHANMLIVVLSRDQTIEGWQCRGGASSVAEMSLTETQPVFLGCVFATARTINGMNWPVFTETMKGDNGDWKLSWHLARDGSRPLANAFGFRATEMTATYSAAFALKQWSAYAYYPEAPVGDYAFSSEGQTDMVWMAGGDIRVAGHASNVKTGESVDCLLIQSQGRKALPCRRENG